MRSHDLGNYSSPTTIDVFPSPSNCNGNLLSLDECAAYAEREGKTLCPGDKETGACGYFHWGMDGNERPKGCFVGSGFPLDVFYNPGGDQYKSNHHWITALCKMPKIVPP